MVAPVVPFGTAPLSPAERDALTQHDRMIVNAWRFELHGQEPCEDDFLRLFLWGKNSKREAA